MKQECRGTSGVDGPAELKKSSFVRLQILCLFSVGELGFEHARARKNTTELAIKSFILICVFSSLKKGAPGLWI